MVDDIDTSPEKDRPNLEELSAECEKWWDERGWDNQSRPATKKSILERSPVARWLVRELSAMPERSDRISQWFRVKLSRLGQWCWEKRRNRSVKIISIVLVSFVIFFSCWRIYRACFLSPSLLLTHCLSSLLDGNRDDLLALFPPEKQTLPSVMNDICRRSDIVSALLENGEQDISVFTDRHFTWGTISIRKNGEYLCLLLKMVSGSTGWVITEVQVSGSMVN